VTARARRGWSGVEDGGVIVAGRSRFNGVEPSGEQVRQPTDLPRAELVARGRRAAVNLGTSAVLAREAVAKIAHAGLAST
jgi:hypothetical protein